MDDVSDSEILSDLPRKCGPRKRKSARMARMTNGNITNDSTDRKRRDDPAAKKAVSDLQNATAGNGEN